MTHILIVDDDEEIRDSLRLVLEEAGYTVEACTNGEDCLEQLRSSAHSLIVLVDYVMPRMSGMDMLHAVAADACLSTRHTYVVVTASPQLLTPPEDHIPPTLQVPVIGKPFELDVLLAAVAEAATRLPTLRGSEDNADSNCVY